MLSDMEVMRESVESAMALNKEAGWLDVENARDAFEAMVKHDQQGRLVKALGDVPAALRDEYSSMSEGVQRSSNRATQVLPIGLRRDGGTSQ